MNKHLQKFVLNEGKNETNLELEDLGLETNSPACVDNVIRLDFKRKTAEVLEEQALDFKGVLFTELNGKKVFSLQLILYCFGKDSALEDQEYTDKLRGYFLNMYDYKFEDNGFHSVDGLKIPVYDIELYADMITTFYSLFIEREETAKSDYLADNITKINNKYECKKTFTNIPSIGTVFSLEHIAKNIDNNYSLEDINLLEDLLKEEGFHGVENYFAVYDGEEIPVYRVDQLANILLFITNLDTNRRTA